MRKKQIAKKQNEHYEYCHNKNILITNKQKNSEKNQHENGSTF